MTIRLQLPDSPPLNGRLEKLPGGRATTPATLARMWGYMRDAQSVLPVYQAARQLTQHLAQKDHVGEARALFGFVRDRIRYVRDPYNLEALQTPAATLTLKTGDCDDKTILLGSLLLAIGMPVVLVAGGYARDRYQHVWLRGQVMGRWLPMDPTEPRPMGWEAPLFEKLVASDPHREPAGVGGKRVKRAMAAQAAAAAAATAAAAKPTATEAEKTAAAAAQAAWQAMQESYSAAAARKKKGGLLKKLAPPTIIKQTIKQANVVLPKLIEKAPGYKLIPKSQRKLLRAAPLIPGSWDDLKKRLTVQNTELYRQMANIDPVAKVHYQHFQRQAEMKTLNQELRALQVKMQTNPTPEDAEKIRQLLARLGMLAGKEKTYNKNGFIAATVASIILTVVTFGAGTVAWQAFVQSVGKGAALAIKTAVSEVLSMVKQYTKANAQQLAQVEFTLRAITANPPPPGVTQPADVINYSLTKQAEQENTQSGPGAQLTTGVPAAGQAAPPGAAPGAPTRRANLFPWLAGAMVAAKLFLF